jgi:hypothetical protein
MPWSPRGGSSRRSAGEDAVAISTVLDGRSAGQAFTLTAGSALPGSMGEPALDRKLAAAA